MQIEIIKAETVEDLTDNHFLMYNKHHKKDEVWTYEYNDLTDCLNGGWRMVDVKDYIEAGYIYIVKEGVVE